MKATGWPADYRPQRLREKWSGRGAAYWAGEREQHGRLWARFIDSLDDGSKAWECRMRAYLQGLDVFVATTRKCRPPSAAVHWRGRLETTFSGGNFERQRDNGLISGHLLMTSLSTAACGGGLAAARQ